MSAASVPTPPHGLSRETRIVVTADQVSADLEGETVILSMTDGVYYGLDRVGARIWHAVATPTALGDVLRMILDEFEVEEARAWADLQALVADLLANRLVVLAPERRD
jgi:hypothetical protein